MIELEGPVKSALGDSLTRDSSGALLRGSIRLIPQRLPVDGSSPDGSLTTSPSWSRNGFSTSPFRKPSLPSVDELSLSLMPANAGFLTAPQPDSTLPQPQHPSPSTVDAGGPTAPRPSPGMPPHAQNISPTRFHPGNPLPSHRGSMHAADAERQSSSGHDLLGPLPSSSTSPHRTRLAEPGHPGLGTYPSFTPRSISPVRTWPHGYGIGGNSFQGLRGGTASSSSLPLEMVSGGAAAALAADSDDVPHVDSVDALKSQFDRQVHRPPTPLAVPGHLQVVSRHFSTSACRRVSRFALSHDEVHSPPTGRGHSTDGSADPNSSRAESTPEQGSGLSSRKSLPCGLDMVDGASMEGASQDALSSFMKGFSG